MQVKKLLFSAIMALVLFGCGKEQLYVQKGVMEANARGSHWIADKGIYAYYSANPKQFFIYGTSSDYRTYYMIAQQMDTAPHWYAFIPGASNGACMKEKESDCNDKFYQTLGVANASGLLILAKEDTVSRRLSGTFRYKAFRADGDSVDVTNGIFADVPYNMGMFYGNTMALKVSGADWTPIDVTGDMRTGIRITAVASNLSMIILDLPKDVKPGSYNLPSTGFLALYEGNFINPDTQVSSSGTVEITSHNTTEKVIEGKLKFTGKSTLNSQSEITDGVFRVRYD